MTKRGFKFVLLSLASLFLVTLLTAGVIFFSYSTYLVVDLISYTPPLSSRIEDRNGQLLAFLFTDEFRIWRDINSMSPHILEATIAIEDERFYTHFGVDPIAVARAAEVNVTTDKLQGASTITQQYVKNSVLSPEVTIQRKLREAYISIIAETIYTKEAILERYLNQVPYGGVTYGVEAAALYYFDKPASDLSIAEAAALAAMTKAPSYYSPAKHPAELEKRRGIVIRKMYELGMISEEEKKTALAETPTYQMKLPETKAPHFVQNVKTTLTKAYGLDEIETSGYTIKTSLDLATQTQTEQAVADEITGLSNYNVSNGAALVMDPQTGRILSWVGSKNFSDPSIDGEFDILTAKRQPGSALKPFLYALAIDTGYGPNTILHDTETTYLSSHEEYKPVNYDRSFHGPVTMRQALANSYNVPATRMVTVLGVSQFAEYLTKLGFEPIDPSQVGISLALGGHEVSPVNLATAYATLAHNGQRVTPISILEVKDRTNNKLTLPNDQPAKSQPEQVISPEAAFIISDILADDSARQPAFGSNSVLSFGDKQVAVKTGTSNEKRDNWTIGFTPNRLVLTWVGNNDNSPMAGVASGTTGASTLWQTIMEQQLNKTSVAWYDPPPTLHQEAIQAETGGKYCDQGTKKTEWFLTSQQPVDCLQFQQALYEVRDGNEVKIMNLSDEEVASFNTDPLAFIETHGDIMQADDTPTEVLIKTAAENIPDPLTQLAGTHDKIQLGSL